MSPDPSSRSTLVMFCRRPAPGVGKQRIAAKTSPELALALSEHLLAIALEDAAAWPGPVALAPANDADRDWAATLLDGMSTIVPQGEGNLGMRLNRVDSALRAAGHERLIFIGTDAPLLDEPYYAAARDALDRADAVLGPAADGGVTLMGSRVPWPELADLPWSTRGLGTALRARCESLGLTVSELPVRYDVDEAAQLPQLAADLAGDSRPARRALRAWLQESLQARVSVVIPVLGDVEPLQALLSRLHALSPPPLQIIVVDGGTSEDCRRLCAREQVRYCTSSPGRGRQLREGAAHALGTVLWFLHADAEPAADAVAVMRRAIADGACGGYFRFRFAGITGQGQRLLAALINLRARYGVPYGDQGIFATRDAYERAGGFADEPLFEEVPLVRALRRHGRFVAVDAPIGVSPRRWQRDGWLRRTFENRLLALAYLAGVSPQRLATRYRAGTR